MAVFKVFQEGSVRASDSSNDAIREQFAELETSQREKMLEEMTSNKRRVCIQILERNSLHFVTPKDQQRLQKKIEEVKVYPCAVRHGKKAETSFIREVGRYLAENIISFFGFLSARKANNIITRLFTKQEAAKNPCRKAKVSKAEGSSFKDEVFTLEIFEDKTFEDLENVTFKNCVIRKSFFSDAKLKNCRFENCQIEDTLFHDAELKDVIFINCKIANSSFEEAAITNCTFSNVTMPATHFLGAIPTNCVIEESNLKNTVFFDTFKSFTVDENSKKTAIITKPITSMLVSPHEAGVSTPRAHEKVDQRTETIPLRIAITSRKDQFIVQAREMWRLQEAIEDKGEEFSRAKRMIDEILAHKEKYPISARILAKAEVLANNSSALFLPGGVDVPPAFYGGKEQGPSDYRRAILELGLIANSFTKGIPLMGVCRGFQIANVYFGAQLQDVEGHSNMEQKLELKVEEKRGLYAHVMKDTVIGACFHHQGVDADKPPEAHLETSAAYDGVIKAAEPKEGGAAPMILLQFHPEFYTSPSEKGFFFSLFDKSKLSDNNELFWEILGDSATAYKNKKQALEEIKSKRAG